jgi:hypothetical protein
MVAQIFFVRGQICGKQATYFTGAGMARAHLQPKHKQAAIYARMSIIGFRAMRAPYKRKGKFATLFNDFYISMVILANDDRNGRRRPCSINSIAKATELSRSAVRERTTVLERYSVIVRAGRGYVSNPAYFNNVSARTYARLRDAILGAAAEMKKIR